MFSFTVTPTINIIFDDQESRPKKSLKVPGQDPLLVPLYTGQENVSGVVDISLPPGERLSHHIGQPHCPTLLLSYAYTCLYSYSHIPSLTYSVTYSTYKYAHSPSLVWDFCDDCDLGYIIEIYLEKGNPSKFTCLVRELEGAGTITQNKSFRFEFSTEKPYETYSGMNVRLRYFVRVTIARNYSNNVKEQEFAVQNFLSGGNQAIATESPTQGIKMEVGIEDCLHIEFEFDKQKYHIQDVILGKIYFHLVRIKIKHMELAVIRREAAGMGASAYNESENIIKFELMDGAPIKGKCFVVSFACINVI
eukprot:scaffold147_cov164-Ochromonas_danica.AAC.4